MLDCLSALRKTLIRSQHQAINAFRKIMESQSRIQPCAPRTWSQIIQRQFSSRLCFSLKVIKHTILMWLQKRRLSVSCVFGLSSFSPNKNNWLMLLNCSFCEPPYIYHTLQRAINSDSTLVVMASLIESHFLSHFELCVRRTWCIQFVCQCGNVISDFHTKTVKMHNLCNCLTRCSTRLVVP